jgi:hypothetical protein
MASNQTSPVPARTLSKRKKNQARQTPIHLPANVPHKAGPCLVPKILYKNFHISHHIESYAWSINKEKRNN